MKFFELSGILALSLLLLGSGLAQADDISWCEHGQDLESREDYHGAIDALTRCLDSGALGQENMAVAHNNRGSVWFKLGDHQKAFDDYSRAIALDPSYPLAYFNRGNLWSTGGGDERAIGDYGSAIDLDPQYAGAYNNRGAAWQRLGDYELAIEDYNHSVDLAPANAVGYNNRGNAWRLLGDHQRAIDNLDRAIALDPAYATAFLNRGIAWSELGDYRRAVLDYDRFIELDPEDAGSYRIVAWALLEARAELDTALDYAEQAVRLDPQAWVSHDTHGHILAAMGRREPALAAFERGIALADANTVRGYQEELLGQGYAIGATDGVYGSSTRAALIACIRDVCTLWDEQP